ncbi:hypothetical protein DB30_04618 [Enhygromyxa salina]|uniref:DUF6817 domain-containing protein n=1 Tax=Enhygromyxa salina TaxID=215803 RepID=A0A0C2A6X8_9BACT|nr:hypothetical protein DB30_04618 [Enhygromyxa salina]
MQVCSIDGVCYLVFDDRVLVVEGVSADALRRALRRPEAELDPDLRAVFEVSAKQHAEGSAPWVGARRGVLHAARVAVLGDGRLARCVADELARAGARVLTSPDAEPEPASLELDVDLVFCCLEGASHERLLAIERAAARGSSPLVFLTVGAQALSFGPRVFPGSRGCLACSRSALLPSPAQLAPELLPQLHTHTLDDSAAAQMVACAAAALAVRELEGRARESDETVIELAWTGERQRHHIACSCRPARAATDPTTHAASTRSASVEPSLAWAELSPRLQALELALAGPDHRDPLERLDPDVPAMLRELVVRHADDLDHATGSFRAHLEGTWRALVHWRQPRIVCRAGLFHSCLATSYYERALYRPWEQRALARAIGLEATTLVHLFCTIDRPALHDDLDALDELPAAATPVRNRHTGERAWVPTRVVVALLLIEIANLAEQSGGDDGMPSAWMARASRWTQLATPWLSPALPIFDRGTARLSETDERAAIEAYRVAIQVLQRDADAAQSALIRCAEHNPWVAEPWLLQALLADRRADLAARAQLLDAAKSRLASWPLAWDKRYGETQWRALAHALRRDPTPS